MELLVASRILGWYSTHELVAVTTKQKRAKDLDEYIGGVGRRSNTFEPDEVLFHPLAEDMIFNVDVAGT